MIPAQLAIARLRRGLTLGLLFRLLLIAAAVLAVLIETIYDRPVVAPAFAVGAIAIIWLLYHSAKGTRLAALCPTLIAAGQYDQAELNIDQALRSFWLFRSIKLRSLHHLAILRHAQSRYAEAALLARALLSQHRAISPDLSRSTRLVLADSLLELGDLPGVYESLSALYQHRLSLSESLELQAIQIDYLSRIGAWSEMLSSLSHKLQLVELMPSVKSARTHAFLALAAHKTNKPDLASYFRRRAELLADTTDLIARRPLLGPLWP